MAEHPAQEIALALGDPPQQETVAEEIEAELLGRAVGHVALVGLAAFLLRHLRFDHAHGHAQGAIDGSHPFGVAAGEVVVDRGQVAALADQGIQIHRQRGGQGLALAGLHLGDRAVEHGDAAQELDVEVPHVDGPPAGLADQGVGLDQQLRQRLAALGPIAEREAALAELLVLEFEQFRLHGADLGHELGPIRHSPAVGVAESVVSGDPIKSIRLLTRVARSFADS